MPIGSSDHNLIIIIRNTKVSRPGPTVIFKRSYKLFNHQKFTNDVMKICWSEVLVTNNPETALLKIYNLFLPLVEKHEPLRKFAVKNVKTRWLNKEIKDENERSNKKDCNHNRK